MGAVEHKIEAGDMVVNPRFIGLDGEVLVEMPGGMHMKLTSDMARLFAQKIYAAAEKADGNDPTHLLIMPMGDGK